METRLLRADEEGALAEAARILRAGGLVAFPTETVYGLGALGLDPDAVRRIFEAKGRPLSDPLILHIGDPSWLDRLARRVTPAARRLAGAFWPGPLTLVVDKAEGVPGVATAGLDSVAVRMPANPVALELLRAVGEPVAAPSANLFSRPSPTTARHVLADLAGRIDAVLDGGPTEIGVESTVVDVRDEEPVILRPGGIPRDELERVLGEPVAAREGPRGAGRSPGLLTKHYSPRAEVVLFEGPDAAVQEAIRREADAAPGETGILGWSEDLPALRGSGARVIDLGSRRRPEEAARRLYAALRQLDEEGVRRILARTAPAGGLGDALNDRLLRAASGRVHRIG